MNRSWSGIFRRYGPELLVLGAAAALVLVARGRWISTLGDYGIWYSDLESLSHGARLMRDIRFPYGPLSLLILDAVTRLLGQRVDTVAAVEFALGLAAALGIIRFSARFLRSPERWVAAALLSTAVFWIPGEGSLLYPYAPAVSIGFLFLLLSLSLGVRGGSRETSTSLTAIAGVAAGLAYLTKQEMGAAAAFGLAAGWIAGANPRAILRRGFLGGSACLATIVAGYAIVFRGLPFFRTAQLSVLWPFSRVPSGWREQYASVTGADSVAGSIRSVVAACGAIAAGTAGLVLIWALIRRLRPVQRSAALTLLAGSAAAVFVRTDCVSPFAAIPVAVVGAIAWAWRHRTRRDHAIPLVMLSAASIPLLTRVGWRGWSDGPFTAIGYSLAIPIFVWAAGSLIDAFCGAWPASETHRFLAAAAGIAATGILAASTWPLLRIGRWPEPAVRYQSFRGAVWIPPAWGEAFRNVGEIVATTTKPADTVLFLPESHGLNFLLARDGPFPGARLDPALDSVREADAIRRISSRPPVLIVQFDQDFQPFGTAGYGTQYGRALSRWIDSHYRTALRSGRHGIAFRILESRESIVAPTRSNN